MNLTQLLKRFYSRVLNVQFNLNWIDESFLPKNHSETFPKAFFLRNWAKLPSK